ncbi:MAG: MBL fold metallo-hydrolase [Burkholderiaceae bacterium]|nr:MBL fold metallo-hydrolase [Burkholderiaceae bacterium]
MKLTIFQAGKGDSLLLTSQAGTNLMIDGGMPDAYSQFIAPHLGALQQRGESIDLLYVSHIDQDHVGGVLRLLDDLIDWRVYDYQLTRPGASPKEPTAPRPPPIRAIWHNAFSTLLAKNAGAIESMLAQSAAALSCASASDLRAEALAQAELAQSIQEAIRVSQRISARQLGIALNADFGGRLALVGAPGSAGVPLGDLKISVIGPFGRDLTRLRGEWNTWLKDHQARISSLLKRARIDEDRLGNEGGDALGPLIEAADAMGDRTEVTAPNLASLMLLVEEAGKSALLTGDGHWQDILAGLKHHGRLNPAVRAHFDLLKVQHHGSEYNWSKQFSEQISADRYVFCGNGEHENPDPRVVQIICDAAGAAGSPGASLYFNTSSASAPDVPTRAHMARLEKLVKQNQTRYGAKLKAQFCSVPSLELVF